MSFMQVSYLHKSLKFDSFWYRNKGGFIGKKTEWSKFFLHFWSSSAETRGRIWKSLRGAKMVRTYSISMQSVVAIHLHSAMVDRKVRSFFALHSFVVLVLECEQWNEVLSLWGWYCRNLLVYFNTVFIIDSFFPVKWQKYALSILAIISLIFAGYKLMEEVLYLTISVK